MAVKGTTIWLAIAVLKKLEEQCGSNQRMDDKLYMFWKRKVGSNAQKQRFGLNSVLM